MFTLLWNLSAALRGYLRFYMPTNRTVDRLRGPRGRKWAIPVSLIATPSYLFSMSICANIVERGGPAYLNLLVLLFAWNAIKFAATGVLLSLSGRHRGWAVGAGQLSRSSAGSSASFDGLKVEEDRRCPS